MQANLEFTPLKLFFHICNGSETKKIRVSRSLPLNPLFLCLISYGAYTQKRAEQSVNNYDAVAYLCRIRDIPYGEKCTNEHRESGQQYHRAPFEDIKYFVWKNLHKSLLYTAGLWFGK